MKKIRIAALLLAAALAASALTGCGDAKAQTGETKTQTGDSAVQNQDQQNQQQPPGNGRGTMAKVVSLDGDQLTEFWIEPINSLHWLIIDSIETPSLSRKTRVIAGLPAFSCLIHPTAQSF
jgi:ABC-type oligopeptide transport system substrate-binding subunit